MQVFVKQFDRIFSGNPDRQRSWEADDDFLNQLRAFMRKSDGLCFALWDC